MILAYKDLNQDEKDFIFDWLSWRFLLHNAKLGRNNVELRRWNESRDYICLIAKWSGVNRLQSRRRLKDVGRVFPNHYFLNKAYLELPLEMHFDSIAKALCAAELLKDFFDCTFIF